MSKRSSSRRRPGRDSKAKGSYQRHDAYFHKAREQGFAARSVYKLDEIQARAKLMKPGDRVLDLGCAPGAWLQLAAKVVGARGRVVGVDLEAVTLALPAQVVTVQDDVFEIDPASLRELAGGPFQVVLSDLAPHTTGIRHVDQARSLSLVERAQQVAEALMVKGGAFVAKVFDGADFAAYAKALEQHFGQVKILRPKATRSHSKEVYVIASRWRGADDATGSPPEPS